MRIDCDQTREALSADLDGEQGAADATNAQNHLNDCPACSHWYTEMTKINRRLRLTAVPDAAPTQGFTQRVLSLIDLKTVCGCGDRCGCSEPCGCGDLCACRQGA